MALKIKDITALFPDHLVTRSPDTVITGVCQDTRKIKKGELYVAIRGENFDGQSFVEEAFAKGAALALVEKDCPKRDNLIRCDNTVKALGHLAGTLCTTASQSR